MQITLGPGSPGQWQEPQHAGPGVLGPTLELLAATEPSKHPLAPSKPTHPLTMYPEASLTNSYSSVHTHLATCGAKCTRCCPQAGRGQQTANPGPF